MARQPKHDYLKRLVGSSTERSSRPRRQYGDSFHKVVEISSHQATILNQYIINETKYFNKTVNLLQPRLKSNPHFFSELTDRQIALFALIAFYAFDVTTLINKKSENTELPERLEPYRDILFGIHGDKEIGLSDRLSVFYEQLSMQGNIWPYTREYMAFELLDFCIKQARPMRTARSTFEEEGNIDYFSTSPEVLQDVNLMQKRHIQLLKKDVELTWDEKNERTLIKIPHLQTPIKLEALNIVEHFNNWNFLIIHQDPQEIILTKAHWEIDFRTTFSRYLIKYIECINPNSKMKSRHLRGR